MLFQRDAGAGFVRREQPERLCPRSQSPTAPDQHLDLTSRGVVGSGAASLLQATEAPDLDFSLNCFLFIY